MGVDNGLEIYLSLVDERPQSRQDTTTVKLWTMQRHWGKLLVWVCGIDNDGVFRLLIDDKVGVVIASPPG